MSNRTLRLSFYLVRLAAKERSFEKKINFLANKFSKYITKEVIEKKLFPLDPSPKKDFLEWLCLRVSDGDIKEKELPKLPKLLQTYLTVIQKPSDAERFGIDRDILRYKFSDLKAFDRLINGITPNWKDPTTPDIVPGSCLVYDTHRAKAVRIGGPGVPMNQAIEAATFYAEDTEWCTADERDAAIYLERGPLYVLFRDGDKYIQTDGNQVMDVYDNHKSFNRNPKLWGLLTKIKAIPEHSYLYQRALKERKRLTPEEEKIVAKDPQSAYNYARWVIKGPFPLGEKAIARKPMTACKYATDVLHGEFLLGEDAIAKSMQDASRYVYYLKKRVPKLEPLFASNWERAIFYAKIIKGEFPLGESVLAKNPNGALQYAQVIQKRFPAGEAEISQFSRLSLSYVNILGTPFPQGEDAIAKDPEASLDYAELFGRFEKGEKAIALRPRLSFIYANLLGEPFILGEPAIAMNHEICKSYVLKFKRKTPILEKAFTSNAFDALKYARIFQEPFPEGEKAISRDAGCSFQYTKILGKRFLLGEPEIFSDPHWKDDYINLVKEMTGEDLSDH